MALILADRVKESTTTTGTSDFALGGAITGFQTFAAAVGANNTTYYAIADGADWEVGLGTLSSDGLTLARTTVLQSSNSDSKVSFASGTKHLFVTYAADKAVFEDASGNVTLPANLTVTGGSTTDSVQLDLTAAVTPAVGQIAWDAAQGTASLGLLGGNIISRIGQSLVAYVTNAESVTITKGQAVYLFSAQGDRATVKLAYNTGDATSAKTLGIVGEDITANGTGFVICQGVAYGLNLAAYTAGDTLYLGATAGSLTATKPYAPNHLVYIGVVEKANAGAGQLYVRVQNGYELDEIHNVSAQSPTTGQQLVYNASTSLWEKSNAPVISGGSINNTTIGATTASSGAFTTLSASSDVTLSGGTANGVTYLNGSKQLVSGSALTFDGTNLLLGNTASTGLSTGQLQVGTASVSDSAIQMLSNTTGTSGVYFGDGTTGGDRYRGAIEYANNGDILKFYSGSSAQLNLTSTSLYTASGINVGIGNNNPQSKLHIQSTVGTAETLITLQTAWNSPSGNKSISWTDGSGRLGAIGVNYTSPQGAMTFGSLYNSGYNTTDLMTLTPSSLYTASQVYVGIGTNNPLSKLHVAGGSTTQIRIESSVTQSNIAFYDAYDSGGFTRNWAIVSNKTAYGDLVFMQSSTQGGDPLAGDQRLYFNILGNVGIGTNNPTSKLTVIGNIKAGYDPSVGIILGLAPSGVPSNDVNAYVLWGDAASFGGNNGDLIYIPRTSTSADHRFYTGNVGLATEKVRITYAGNVGIGTNNPNAKLEVYVTRTSSTNATAIILNDNVTGAQTNGVYKSIQSQSNNGSSVSEIRFIETDGTNNNTAIAFATAGTAGGLSEKMRVLNTGAILALAGATLNSSGTGIGFPTTQSASSDPNVLDDYEEGTWTPKCGDGTTDITTVYKAVYTKIGKLVTIELDCTVNNPNPSNSNFITNLPFAGSVSGAGNGGCAVGYTNAGAAIGFHITSSTTTLYAQNLITNSIQNLSGTRVIFSFSYTTSS